MVLPAVPNFHHTAVADFQILGNALPLSFNFEPTWGSIIGQSLHNDCEQLLIHLPSTGAFTPNDPYIVQRGDCFVGFYVTAPRARRRVPVSDSWHIINTWLSGALLMYAGVVPAGWTLNLQSGIQICMWSAPFLNLPHGAQMPNIPHTGAGNLAAGLNRLAAQLRSDGAPYLSLLPAARAFPPATGPLDVPIPVPGWANGPRLELLQQCLFMIRSFFVADWFLHSGGIFMRTPIMVRNERCTFTLFFTSPPADRKGRLALPTGRPSMYHQTWTLMRQMMARDGLGAYLDMRNGLQVALFESEVADPRYICALLPGMSVRQCLENNIRMQ
ncbi:hypothetical protein MMC11_002704 [Xylographa trunciseda]|nr:hypothetical protein [Xylographa trunciseda]